MITKRATLLAINSFTSSLTKVCSSINHSTRTLTSSINFATQASSDYHIDPYSNHGNNGFDNNSSYAKHPSLFNGGQNGVEIHHTQGVNPQSVGTNGNFGGYYRQSYAVSPQHSGNGGSYGRSDAGCQGVNGNCNPNVSPLNQTASASYTGNVGYQFVNVNPSPDVCHHTGNVGMNQVNRTSDQFSNGGFAAYNTIGQNGNTGRTHGGSPQQNQYVSYERIDARYQGSVNRSFNQNVEQLHQAASDSYTGNVRMSQLNSTYQVTNGGLRSGNFGGGYDQQSYVMSPQQSPNGMYNGSYEQKHDGNQSVLNEYRNPNIGQLHEAAGDSHTGNAGTSQLNRTSYPIPNGGLQNGNFGGYDQQNYAMAPQQSPNGFYGGSYGQNHDGNRGIVNGYCNPNAGQYHQTAGDSYMLNAGVNPLNGSFYQIPNVGIPNGNYEGYYGNFGGYYRQSYVLVPLQNPNVSYSRSYGQSDVVYQVVNGNWNPGVGQYHQTAGYSFMGNVAYQVVDGNCDPYVGQFHQTYNIETNQLNRSSPQIPIGGLAYNIVGQHGNLSGYNRQSYAMLPQHSPYGSCNGSYGRSDLAYQVVNEHCDPNVGQYHQTTGGSYMGNVGMNQQNVHPYQILNNRNFQPQQNRNDQPSENVGVNTRNIYSRNNAQNIQPNQIVKVGNYSNPNNFQQKRQNANNYLRNNGYHQKPKDQVSLNSKVDKCFRNIQPRADDDNVGSNIKTTIKDKISAMFHQYASKDSQVSRRDPVEAFPPKEYKGTVEEFDEFCKEGKVKDAVEVLKLLPKQQTNVDLPRYMCLAKACGEAKALEDAKAIHKIITESISPLDVSTCNGLLEMYSRCGSMLDAYGVFHSMTDRDLASWTILITWLAKNELPEDAINMFKQFKKSKIKPDGEIFFGVFSACGALGKAKEGMSHFDSMMNEYNIIPTMKHYASIVDMLGNSGNIAEALGFIEKMPMEPSDDVYETLMKQFSAPEKKFA